MVAVISSTKMRLMPTSAYRARRLLKEGKAVIAKRRPFTIRLTERETGAVQPVETCVDTGYVHIGTSVKSEKHEYLAVHTALGRNTPAGTGADLRGISRYQYHAGDGAV